MTDATDRTPALTARAIADAEARRARESAALRDNLLRRKAQARARSEAAPALPAPPEPEPG